MARRALPVAAPGALPAGSGGATETTLSAFKSANHADLAAVLAALTPPSTPAAITPSDSTDLTSIASVGISIGGDGTLAFRCAGAPSTTVSLPVVAGQFVWGKFTRVMAATTATGLVGWAP